MNQSLEELQQTLANLQRQNATGLQLQKQQNTIVPVAPIVDKDTIRTFVKEILLEIQQSSTIPANVAPKITIQEAICSALSQEEQNWLCQDAIILGIPDFLTTSEGKEVTKLFLSTYREYVNANNT